MKSFGLGVLVGVAGLVGAAAVYPTMNEDANNICHALEHRIIQELQANGELAAMARQNEMMTIAGLTFVVQESKGAMANGAAKALHPNIPPSIQCAGMYYDLILDPEGGLDRIRSKLIELDAGEFNLKEKLIGPMIRNYLNNNPGVGSPFNNYQYNLPPSYDVACVAKYGHIDACIVRR